MRDFISLTVEHNPTLKRAVYIRASANKSLHNPNGITTTEALSFLHSLNTLRKQKRYKHPTFVWYAAHLDVEMLLQDLPARAKDIIFPSPKIAEAKKTLHAHIEKARLLLKRCKYTHQRQQIIKALINLNKSLRGLAYVNYQGFRIRNIQGKILGVYKGKSGVTIFDICSFFKGGATDLALVAREYLGAALPALCRLPVADLPLWKDESTHAQQHKSMCEYAEAENTTLIKLAERLEEYFECAGIMLRRWYGVSAATNLLLTKWNTRSQFRRMTEENTPRELWRALSDAFYGGRIETVKLGTIYNVNVYDINSAYAYAVSLLGRINRKFQFTREYSIRDIFAVWFVEYDLPSTAYLGILPHRTFSGSQVYRKAGRGWYYSPEVRELMRRYPDHARVKYGYTIPYTPVSFGREIQNIYAHRQTLQAESEPGEKLFKLLLASLYGKFSQTVGYAQHFCRAWAGWVTSFVRAMLLEAVEGQEEKVIAFGQDAVHTIGELKGVDVGAHLGGWKAKHYERGIYLQSGVYQHSPNGAQKKRGASYIDFEQALLDLNNGLPVKASREFFVGWRLKQQLDEARHEVHTTRLPRERADELLTQFRGSYLERVNETININVENVNHRSFGFGGHVACIDWTKEYRDSKLLSFNDGRQSAQRQERDYSRRVDRMLDVISARR